MTSRSCASWSRAAASTRPRPPHAGPTVVPGIWTQATSVMPTAVLPAPSQVGDSATRTVHRRPLSDARRAGHQPHMCASAVAPVAPVAPPTPDDSCVPLGGVTGLGGRAERTRCRDSNRYVVVMTARAPTSAASRAADQLSRSGRPIDPRAPGSRLEAWPHLQRIGAPAVPRLAGRAPAQMSPPSSTDQSAQLWRNALTPSFCKQNIAGFGRLARALSGALTRR